MQEVLVLVLLAAATLADVNVMKDVTLGFGQALDKCRQEVTLLLNFYNCVKFHNDGLL